MKFSEQIFNEFLGVTLGEINNTVFNYQCFIPVDHIVYEEDLEYIQYVDFNELTLFLDED